MTSTSSPRASPSWSSPGSWCSRTRRGTSPRPRWRSRCSRTTSPKQRQRVRAGRVRSSDPPRWDRLRAGLQWRCRPPTPGPAGGERDEVRDPRPRRTRGHAHHAGGGHCLSGPRASGREDEGFEPGDPPAAHESLRPSGPRRHDPAEGGEEGRLAGSPDVYAFPGGQAHHGPHRGAPAPAANTQGRLRSLVVERPSVHAVGRPSPPVDLGHHHLRANGIAMHYVRQGEGFPLVLLHGWPEFWRVWRQSFHQLPWAADLVGSSRGACELYVRHFLSHWAHDPGVFDDEDVEAWVDNFLEPGNLRGGFNWYIAANSARLELIRHGPPKLDPIKVPSLARSGARAQVPQADSADAPRA